MAEVDIDLLWGGLAVLFLSLMNNDFADEGSQYLRCQLLNTYILSDNIKELLHIGALAFECINFFLQVNNNKRLLFISILPAYFHYQ